MKMYRLALGMATVLTIGMMVVCVRKHKVIKRLVDVSDAGYETAYDVLYPLPAKKFNRLFR